MTAFDSTIRVGQAFTETQVEEDGKAYDGQLVFSVITVLPVGPQQVMPLPLGILRVPLNKQACGSLIESLQELHASLDERSNIEVATNLSAVEAAAQRAQEATKTFTAR